MATINVRVEDDVRDRLKERAEDEDLTLSEYVRDLLREAVASVSPDVTRKHGDEPTPESFSTRDRIIIALLHRILARVLPEDASGPDGNERYQLMKAEIMEAGFTGEYWWEVAGFETELSKRDSRRVVDILQMFRVLTFSVDRLSADGESLDDMSAMRLRFRGFDHNDSLEGHMAGYVEFLMRDGDKWEELHPQIEESDGGNSHMRMLDIYMRMLAEYRRITDRPERRYSDYLLSKADLEAIAASTRHPSARD